MTLCWFIAHYRLQHGGKSDQEDNARPDAAGHGTVFDLKVQHSIFLAKRSKEQEPGPAPPAMHSKALHQKAPQPYLIYLPEHHGEIGLRYLRKGHIHERYIPVLGTASDLCSLAYNLA